MATLTTAQQATILSDIQAASDMKNLPLVANSCYIIAGLYNLPASPTFYVLSTAVSLVAIVQAIKWKKMTPFDAVPTDTALDVAIWQARSLSCQGCQFNIQTILQAFAPQGTLDATQKNTTQGLNDSLSAVPSAAGGAAQDAGWATVQPILARLATRIEKLLANTAGGNGTTNLFPALAPFADGYQIQPSDIGLILGISL